MLGDSMRRRRGMGDRGEGAQRDAKARDSKRGPAGGERGRMRPMRWIGGGLLAIAVAYGLGYLIATMVLFPRPALAGDEIAVPDLTSLELGDARAALDALGLRVGDTREIAAPERRVGVVVAQAPVEGQRLRPGGAVRLGLSAGTPTVVVPDLTGMTAQGARVLAEQVGLVVEQRDELSDEPAGQVLRTQPAPSTRVEAPSRVIIVVSMGPPVVDTLDNALDSLFEPFEMPAAQP